MISFVLINCMLKVVDNKHDDNVCANHVMGAKTLMLTSPGMGKRGLETIIIDKHVICR